MCGGPSAFPFSFFLWFSTPFPALSWHQKTHKRGRKYPSSSSSLAPLASSPQMLAAHTSISTPCLDPNTYSFIARHTLCMFCNVGDESLPFK